MWPVAIDCGTPLHGFAHTSATNTPEGQGATTSQVSRHLTSPANTQPEACLNESAMPEKLFGDILSVVTDHARQEWPCTCHSTG